MENVKHSVLIIDDEEHVLKAIQRLLRRDGYTIHLAENGKAGLDILAAEEIAVIVCDQRMPGMSGSEVLAEAYRLHPDTVRITLTGYTDLNAAQASINEGRVNHFLLKPWDDEHLRSVIRDGVRAYELILENRRLEALTQKQQAELKAWNEKLEQQVKHRTEQLCKQNEFLTKLRQRLEQSLRDTVEVMVGMLEANNPNIAIHSKRVAELARVIGERLSLPEEELNDLEFAARLHDIGRVAKVHSKKRAPGAAPPKREGLLRHSDSGYAILSHVTGFEAVANAVRHQYEYYDGSGHPEGLENDDIPLAARIIAVTDVYDTAVYSSTYPTRATRGAGRKALLSGHGKRFDPMLVDILLHYIHEEGEGHCADSEVELSPAHLRRGMRLSRPLCKSDEVLLLASGTVLTNEQIEHVRAAANIDPLLNGVFVVCIDETEEAAAPPQPAAPAMPQPAAPAMPQPGDPVMPQAPVPGAPPRPATPAVAGPPVQPLAPAPPDAAPPVTPAPAAPVSPPQVGAAMASRKVAKLRVLVVDDVEMLCNALRRELRSAGFDSAATTNGYEALKLARAEHFDLVISDVQMPAMPGKELIRRLGEAIPDLPCIVLTGNAKIDELRELMKAPNVVGALVKPWDKERLITTITAGIEKRPRPAPATA